MFKYLIFLVWATFSLNLSAQELPNEPTEEERDALRARFFELVETLLPEMGYTVILADFNAEKRRARTYFQTKDGGFARKQTIELLYLDEGEGKKLMIIFTKESNCILDGHDSQVVITVNNQRINTLSSCLETDNLNPDGTRQRVKIFRPISDEAHIFIGREMIKARVILLELPSDSGYETPFAVTGFAKALDRLLEPAI